MADERTIDELAQHVGLPSSTIRLYQTRGLLPPPRKQGRVAWYGPGHVARIDLIGRLQERGFSLAAIGELVAGWEGGRSLDDVLGLEQRVPGALSEPLRLHPHELAARFPTIPITAEVMNRVVEMGLVTLDTEGRVVVPDPTFLEVGAALVGLGIPLDEVLDEAANLQMVMGDVAERFAGLFDRHVWRKFTDAGRRAGDLNRVEDALARLGPLADQVVLATLRQALARAADRFLAAEAERSAE